MIPGTEVATHSPLQFVKMLANKARNMRPTENKSWMKLPEKQVGHYEQILDMLEFACITKISIDQKPYWDQQQMIYPTYLMGTLHVRLNQGFNITMGDYKTGTSLLYENIKFYFVSRNV